MRIVYWIVTVLVAVGLLMSGIGHLARAEPIVEGMTHMGYPLYMMTLLGVWKVLGAIALLAPGAARVKEWAYAGAFFLLTGAAISHVVGEGNVGGIVAPLVLLVLLIASYVLRPEDRTMAPGNT